MTLVFILVPVLPSFAVLHGKTDSKWLEKWLGKNTKMTNLLTSHKCRISSCSQTKVNVFIVCKRENNIGKIT